MHGKQIKWRQVLEAPCCSKVLTLLYFFNWCSHVASTAHTFGVDKVNFLNLDAQFPCDCPS